MQIFKVLGPELNQQVGFSTPKNTKIHIFQFLEKLWNKAWIANNYSLENTGGVRDASPDDPKNIKNLYFQGPRPI